MKTETKNNLIKIGFIASLIIFAVIWNSTY